MKNDPRVIRLSEYTPANYQAIKTELTFDLYEDHAIVMSRVQYEQNAGAKNMLRLEGLEQELKFAKLNGEVLDLNQLDFSPDYLILEDLPSNFELELATKLYPSKNTALEGLYKSNGKFCTQCEPEGFRRITYYLDRPDVMSEYVTTVIADKKAYPILLSNGNPIERKDLKDGRHMVVWHDPFPKPSYLFALVAGDLSLVEDSYRTKSGRDVTLQIFVEKENLDKCDHAMQSVKDSMKWDEDVYGLEYDLDIFMIVAVSDFNMGAMENKGLNIFNSKYVLANPKTATDTDFEGIQSVVGHEYFHNWTGNRVTCRDWFQLSLKEGLTVFRDQEFSADLNSRGVCRIADVKALRASQFVEDGGPMAHPVRPDSYIEINNFYTSTIYNKGAEVIRMFHTILGAENYYKGIDLYFQRHDGEAATIENFVSAMEDASGQDLNQFTRWYHQAGTPSVNAEMSYSDGSISLNLEQILKKTPGQDKKKAQLIPIKTSFFDSESGKAVPFTYNGETKTEHVLMLGEMNQEFTFEGFSSKPVPSLARSFSAPIYMNYPYTDSELMFLMKWDNDDFNRYEAAQNLAISLMAQRKENKQFELAEDVISAYKFLLDSNDVEMRIKAKALTLPSLDYLVNLETAPANLDLIAEARSWLLESIAKSCYSKFLDTYHSCAGAKEFSLSADEVGKRELKATCLGFLMAGNQKEATKLAKDLFDSANNMTDTVSSMRNLVDIDDKARSEVLDDFYKTWSHDQLVMDKWFALQASSYHKDVLKHVKDLLKHKDFDVLNPNRVRSVMRMFAHANPDGFHHISGAGYKLMADYAIKLDSKNSQVAAMLANTLSQWKRYDKKRQGLMKAELKRIASRKALSKDVYEIVSKSLK